MLSTPQVNPFSSPGQTLFLLGFNGDVDTASVPEDCWPQGGLIPFPDVAAVVSTVSDSALDTAAGTGAQTLTIFGVDTNFDEISETITLNGLTPVLTTQLFLYVNLAIVITAGSLNANQGLITFTIDGNLCNVISIAKSQTQACAGIIPNPRASGTIPRVVNFFAFIGRQPNVLATATLVRTSGTTGVTREPLDIPITGDDGPIDIDIVAGGPFIPGEKVVGRITEISANNTLVAAGLQFIWT